MEDEDGVVSLLCKTCGAYATRRPAKLIRRCTGQASTGSTGGRALRRIANGQHPAHTRNALVSRITNVSAQHIAHAAQQLDVAVTARFAAGVQRRNDSRISKAGYARDKMTPQQISQVRSRLADDQVWEQVTVLRHAHGEPPCQQRCRRCWGLA